MTGNTAGDSNPATDTTYRLILESVRDYAIFSTDADGRIETWPPGAETVFGWTAEEAVGLNVAVTFTPEDREQGLPEEERAKALRDGTAPNVRWHMHKDGHRVFIDGSVQRIPASQTRSPGFLVIGQDTTLQRDMEERQKILVAELQHRTRNLMGIVRSMFVRTVDGAADMDDLAATYQHRLGALGRVQGLLSRLDDKDRVSFDELIRAELSAIGATDMQGFGDRVTLDGPGDVFLRSSTVQTFALALHELATNASKYGALAQPGGRLSVRWRLIAADRPRLRVEWVESGVDMSASDDEAEIGGYGRELIEEALPYQLHAPTSFVLGPDGVRCTIELPVSDKTNIGDAGRG